MILKLIVLLLIVGASWCGFKIVGRNVAKKHAEDPRKENQGSEDIKACEICGIFVTASPSKCGRESCPY